jgi:ribulose-phosphate 3-epimerase
MAADQLNLEHEIKRFEVYCDGFHIDAMDFHFVPNLTFGITAINQIARATNKQLDVHLMVDEPEELFEQLHLRPKSIVTFHIESAEHPDRLIKKIKHKELLAGIAVSPQTSLAKVNTFLPDIDQVLMMGVEPGFSGQEFIPEVMTKIATIALVKKAKQLPFTIAVDGGITQKNIKELSIKGAQSFHVGSAVFEDEDPLTALEKLYDALGERL